MRKEIKKRFFICFERLKEKKIVRTKSEFAREVGYPPQAMTNISNSNGRAIPPKMLEKAIEIFDFSPDYLYLGKGSCFSDDDAGRHLNVLTVVTDENNVERIVHVDKPAQAGYPNELADPTFVKELPTFNLPNYKYNDGTSRSFSVKGDSMEPTLLEGDLVVCSYLEPGLWQSDLKNNELYVVVTKDDVVVKRIINNLVADQSLTLHSDNPVFRSYKIHLRDLREIWRVRVKISHYLPSPSDMDGITKEIEQLKRVIKAQTNVIKEFKNSIDSLNRLSK